jgi:predicted pyridoxine 5'-phosphate oxidase superfamily flavin-nucleotide-binding protein
MTDQNFPRCATIPPAMRPAMQGVIPTCMATASPDGEPNVTYISQVWFVDERHLAISCQFFNKTTRNVRANPAASILTTCPETYAVWRISARYIESRTTGPLYDEMADQLAVIASMAGMSDTFRLLSADVYAVDCVELLHPGVRLPAGSM